MPYQKFDPRGERPPEQSILPKRSVSNFTVIIQLIAILFMVRLVMLLTGVAFFRVPLLDPLVFKVISIFYRP